VSPKNVPFESKERINDSDYMRRRERESGRIVEG
jgi:hypothetical protein